MTPIKSHPLGKFLKPFLNEIDNDPRVQLRIHTYGFYYWTINFPLIAYMFFYLPAIWTRWGLFITLIYSIYANWTSDYTGMSSSQSVINTQKVEAPATTAGETVTLEQINQALNGLEKRINERISFINRPRLEIKNIKGEQQ